MSQGAEGKGADCVLCGKCLEVCPLLAATGREELAPRSKAHLINILEQDPELLSEQEVSKLAEMCLGCGRCKDACSQGVDVPDAVSRLRAKHPGWKTWLWKQWMGKSESLWPVAGKIAGKMPDVGPAQLSGLIKMARSLGREPIQPFVDVIIPRRQRTEALLFSGCAASGAATYWTSSAATLCSSLNISLIEAEFGCCGSGLQGAGLRNERRSAATRNVDIWRASGKVNIITFCASCHAGLAAYGEDRDIFSDRTEAKRWADSLLPLSGLLNSAQFVVSPNALAGELTRAPQTITYHRPCHTHGKDRDEALVQAMLPAYEIEISKACCGFGGVMQLGAPGLTKQVSGRCWSELAAAPETLVLTGCTACVFQLAATAPEGVQVAHWLECLPK